MFHGRWDYVQKPPLGSMLNTKPGDHGIRNTQDHWFILFCHMWEPARIKIHWNSIWLRFWSHMTSHYTRGPVTTLHDFGGVLGPVYTTVEKSTGHVKKGVSQLWLVKNATLDRWVFTLGEENNGGELFSWMIKWHGHLCGGTFWSWASPE